MEQSVTFLNNPFSTKSKQKLIAFLNFDYFCQTLFWQILWNIINNLKHVKNKVTFQGSLAKMWSPISLLI